MRIRRDACLLGCAILAAFVAAPASAMFEGKLTPFVEEKVTHDDNVFRLSKNVDPGSTPTADTYTTTSLGVNLDAPLSRQRFQAGLAWNATRFRQLTDLDFNGHDARATWLWQIGNDLSGQLGYIDNFALAPFAYTQSQTPDPLRTRQAFLNGAYLVTPSWRLQAGGGVFKQTNGAAAFQPNDVTITSGDASLSYVTPANTSFGVAGRVEEGRYPNRTFDPQQPFDVGYRQTTVGVVADWTVTGVSHVAARAGRLSRRYPNTTQSDFDGSTAVVEYDWKLTGKLTLTGVLRRDISPFQDIQSSFVLVRGVTVRPVLNITEKIDVSALLDYSIWDFLGDSGLVTGGAVGRVDHVLAAAASVTYKPLRNVLLQLTVQRESRTSNVLTADYVANIGSLTARLSF